MKPRYKYVRAQPITMPSGHGNGNKLWFQSSEHSDCIWFLGRRRWMLLRRLTESQ